MSESQCRHGQDLGTWHRAQVKSIAMLLAAITLAKVAATERGQPDYHARHSMIGYYQNNLIIIDSWTPYLAYIGTIPEVQVGAKSRIYSDSRWAQPARLHPAPGTHSTFHVGQPST